MDLLPDAKVLAAAFTPKPKDEGHGAAERVNIYDIQPQMWTYERTVSGVVGGGGGVSGERGSGTAGSGKAGSGSTAVTG